MQNSKNEKVEIPPPAYTSVVIDDLTAFSPTLNQLVRILENHDTLHFHTMSPMGFLWRPTIVQIRDSTETPVMSIMARTTNAVAPSGGNRRIISSIEILTTNGETLIGVNNGEVISGDQILGMVEDSLSYRQRLLARNTVGNVVFECVGSNSVEANSCNYCWGCCRSNSSAFDFIENGVTVAHIKKSRNNSSGNELVLLNSRNINPRTTALILYASYLVFLMFFIETPCGRVGERGIAQPVFWICFIIIILIMSLPLWVFLTV